MLRLQPGDAITLFDGRGGEWQARIEQIGRSVVSVQIVEHLAVDRELAFEVTIAMGMPANERMDSVVEKATELGVTFIQPLLCERSVLRLTGDRAEKKVAHWQSVAAAASEQCGRTRVPTVQPVRALSTWLAERGCEAVRGTSSCGDPGLLLLLAVVVVAGLAGAAALRLARVPAPFLGGSLGEPWAAAVVPVLAVLTFGLAHWVTTHVGEEPGDAA